MNALCSGQRLVRYAHQRSSYDPGFTVFIWYTGVRRTLAALGAAARLTAGLDARLEVIVLQVVPYPLPIDEPSVRPSFWTERFKRMVDEIEIEAAVHVYLCRDWRHAVASALPRGSIVVIADRSSWWPRREWRVARSLRAKGYRVIVVEANLTKADLRA